MTISSVDESQRKAARVVGFVYLFVIVVAVFAGVFVNARLIVYDNAAETARNIVAHERLFRLGIASDLIAFAADVVLLTALYVVLKPVNRSLALLAAFLRLVETSVFVVITRFKSDFIPSALAAWGVFSSFLLAASSFAFIIFPDAAKVFSVGYFGGPIFIFELTMGFWLLLKGLRPAAGITPR